MTSPGISPLVLEPLTAEGFAPYGDVATRPTGERRRYLPTMTDSTLPGGGCAVWISSAAALGSLPLRPTQLERHPYTSQTFVPLGGSRYLAIVCDAAADGAPDLARLRGFVAAPSQAVTFRRNVWHHPMTVLDGQMDFVVAMGMTGQGDDDVFVEITSPGAFVLAEEDRA
jgi:ureidoglycolate lyase